MPRMLLLVAAANDPGDRIRRGLEDAFPELPLACARNEREALAAIADAEILLAFSPSISASLIARAPRLKWIQLLGSGTDGVPEALAGRPDLLVTNGRGAQAVPVSETVIALLFALARDLPRLLRNQQEKRWQRWPARLLKGSTIVIVGVGAIAEELAPKCKALGMRVVGVSSAPRTVPGFDEIRPYPELAPTLGIADWVVLLTPLTAATRHLINGSAISCMKREACLVNVARGGVVDEAALVDALREGRIAGAALDVFATEPLPADSPLWATPRAIVSPHVAGLNENYAADLLPLLIDNVRRYLAGERTSLRNVVSLA